MFYIPSFFQQNKAFYNSKCKNTLNINIYLYANINNKVTTRDHIVVLCSNVEETRLDWQLMPVSFFFFLLLVQLTQCGTKILNDCTSQVI